MARLASAAFAALLLLGSAAQAQQQEFFVPRGQQAPPQGQQQQPRPAQQPAQQQRPPQGQQPAQRAQPNPAPLPPGQPPPAAVIGIVDVPEVQRVSTAFTQVREELERRRARLNDDVQREQGRWREEQQLLAGQRTSLSPEQLRARERELQERISDAQRIFRDRNRNLEQAAQGALQEIEQALALTIRQVAASRNVNLMLPRGIIIFNEPAFDLTNEIAQQLNRVLRTVNLPADEGAPAPAPAAARPAQPAQPARPRN
jgi:Skp family chaperone for outer membrane proteins